MKRIAVLLFVFLFAAPLVHAKEYPSLFRGIRPLGMGGAFTAVANDENALFYNPAGLSGQSLRIGIFNPLVEVGEDSVELYQDTEDTDLDDAGEVVELLRDHMGEVQHVRAALNPYGIWSVAGVGIGVAGLGQTTFDTEIHNPIWPDLETRVIVDYGALGGVGLKLPITGLQLGATVKFINRESLIETYTAADIAAEGFEDDIEDDIESGSGVGADIGIIYTFGIPFGDLSCGAVVQNIPEMEMSDAEDIKTQVNAGVAVQPDFKVVSAIFALDYMDIGDNVGEEDDLSKRLHLGAEVELLDWVAVRAGLNQGYWTAGVTLDLWIFRFDVASYAEEVGAHSGQREDRRYLAQISIGW